jgi:acetylglutamate kinase
MSETPDKHAEAAKKAATLSAALPYFRRYSGKTIVVKYGGHAMGDDAIARQFAADIVLLKQVGMNPIVVHGGGPQIGDMLKLSGKDADLIRAKKLAHPHKESDSAIEKALDLGFVGEPVGINTKILDLLEKSDIIPVIAPIGVGDGGETYNINADTVAGAVAAAVKATRFLLLTDVAGVLDKEKKLIAQLSVEKARALIADGTISGGMIPKIETCLDAITGGVEAAVIIDGRVPNAILLELFAEGAGTLIRRGR